MLSSSILGSGLLLLPCGAGILVASALYKEQGGCRVIPGLIGSLFLVAGAMCLDIYRLKPSSCHTLKTLRRQYTMLRVLNLFGVAMKNKLRSICKNCQRQQREILRNILRTNKDTIFAKEHGLTNIEKVEEFINKMPLTCYADYRKYIEMVTEDGTSNVMFPGNAGYVALSSGTTGVKSKTYPKSLQIRKSRVLPWLAFLTNELNSIPGNNYLKRTYVLNSLPKMTYTNSKIEKGPISLYLTGKELYDLYLLPVCPLYQEDLLLYVNLAIGLLQEDIISISAITSSTVLTFFKILERRWEELCDDIEIGHLSTDLDISQDVRQTLNKCMFSNRARAEFLRSEFRKGFKNIAQRIWPQCRAILSIRTGVFQTHARLLRECYTGDIPIITGLHTGAESIYGINLQLLDEHVRYTLLTGLNFFEFIIEDDIDKENPTTLMAHQIEVGRRYEIVVTTFDGLYRYRTEDVVEVTGFFHTVPQYAFVRRAGDILSCYVEKVPEALLFDSILAVADSWTDRTLVEFVSVENIHVETITGTVSGTYFYYVFIEMGEGDEISDGDSEKVDVELRNRQDFYADFRKSETLKQLKLLQLHPGTFDKVKNALLGANQEASFVQFKIPRIIRRKDILKLLLKQRM